ncbi:MAG: class I SAM-dependent methyltransferase [Blastocatellia bacterium]
MINENVEQFAAAMKRDWNERARQDAPWYINTIRRGQSEEEFGQTGAVEAERLVLADLHLLTGGRDVRGLRLLEIGCGAGRMTKHLAGVFGEVVGIDVSGEMIRQATARLSEMANVRLHETSGVDFAILPGDHFDLILSAYVFQHVPSAEVIASNIREAWRVLAPGGVFKFQTSDVTSPDYARIEKDTWSGVTFPEAEIRRFARETGAQLIGLFGAGTQYCWTMLRKRVRPAAHPGQPRIEFYGRTLDASARRIPTSGDQASLTLIVSGLDREQADCNSIGVEINDRAVPARYVGVIGRNFDAALHTAFGGSLDHLTQIEIGVPPDLKSGSLPVRVVAADGAASDPIVVEFENDLEIG